MTRHSTSFLIFRTQSTSLLIFRTFILKHSFAICYFHHHSDALNCHRFFFFTFPWDGKSAQLKLQLINDVPNREKITLNRPTNPLPTTEWFTITIGGDRLWGLLQGNSLDNAAPTEGCIPSLQEARERISYIERTVESVQPAA
jgi:hypothetical protein